jgi:hypothetical protein
MKIKITSLLVCSLFVLTFCFSFSLNVTKVSAATDPVTMDLNWDGTCTDAPTISSTPSYLFFWSGDTVNLNAVNQSSHELDIVINGSGGPITASGGSQLFTRTLSDELNILVYPDSSTGCGNKPAVGYAYIFGAATVSPLSCTLSDNKVWTISANYNNVASVDVLYRGSTYVGDYQTTKGGPGSGDFDTSFQFSAQTTAQTYYLYDGTSTSDILLGQTTCPKAVAPVSPPPSSTDTGTSSTSETSTPGATTTTPTSSSTTPAPTLTKINPINPNIVASANKTISSSNDSLLVGGGIGVLALVIILVILGLTGIWNAPKQFAQYIWHKLHKSAITNPPANPQP